MLSEVSFRPPLLGTDRLLLRGYEPSDKAAILEYASDVETAQYMLWERHRTIADAETFLDGFVSENYAAEALDYAICERDRSERVKIGRASCRERVWISAFVGHVKENSIRLSCY